MTVVAVLRAPRWHAHAACRNTADRAGWIDAEPDSNSSIMCKEVCRTCPVRLTCALTALVHGEREGVWGGMDKADRTALMIIGRDKVA
ncbi:hypothetical protein Lesp02_71700 [Lentzea sp. NBRC 105346]|uniref:WhiB family transcriptional regulator n=1 Tax=Lentzea sp. NBRC 105346 TaxID=3032205 RepID=UPI0024A0DF85|nr:WhiB family transcriptional regulator [Lentzea sp. NBRC 105346]GLZ34983.1 hypothetical protein Lesp02_71700 [Lentzea sp. NBRC 105346]